MLCIVQARMSSERMPGKVLAELRGRSVLGRVVGRVSAAESISSVVVATSDDPSDDPVAERCATDGIPCFRGPLDDVAERFRRVVERAGAESFVRVNGDSPLIDPGLIDRAVGYFRAADCDLATNVLVRTFPVGQSVEVLLASTFGRVCAAMETPEQREHVTGAYYEQPGRYRIVGFTSGMDLGSVRLCVDTPDDYDRVSSILARCADRPGGWRELAAMTGAS